MLRPQLLQSTPTSSLSLLPKPFINGIQFGSLPLNASKSTTTRSLDTKTRKNTKVGYKSSTIKAIASVTQESVKVKAVVTVQQTVGGILSHLGLERGLDDITDLFGKTLLLELVSAELDPKSGQEKPTVKGYAHKSEQGEGEAKYEAEIVIPGNFGEIGAVLVENEHRKEMFVKDIVIDGLVNGPLHVWCNSWVPSKYDDKEKRIFFTNKSHLPSDTPNGLVRLREKELSSIRGNGQGERKKGERIYDYDVYNDLGDPDSNDDLARPVLGGSKYPYPRRCRTGRSHTKKDQESESRSSYFYAPRNEEFSEVKQLTFSAKTVHSVLHALVPSLEMALVDPDLGFPYFAEIDSLYDEGIELPPGTKIKLGWQSILPRLVKAISDTTNDVLRFETPETMDRDRFFWIRDEEFARQTLAGLNPCMIKLVTEWPLKSELDPKEYGPAECAISTKMIEEEIKGFMSVDEAIKQKKLFIIDYHDLLLPYVKKVRELKGTTLYGSRSLYFLTHDGTLRPLAIELTRPPVGGMPQWKQVFRPTWDATGVWLWRLAKCHFLAHDSGIHQLYSHWLRTHCATEPYIIATHRQLSAMHPIYKLLHPHFRYTMEINALARQALINSGGIIESSFTPGKYSVELSSVAYDKLWRFDHQPLPKDLISRGMAVEDPTAPHGIKLAIEDYPYANDGLVLWDAIKQWVTDYITHYYPEASLVSSDKELQSWWFEIRNVGHEDKKDETWWPELKTPADLIDIVTTIAWVASGLHAAVNFGQYTYAGYFPNRPTISRMKIPTEEPVNDEEWKFFMEKPEGVLLSTFPSQMQATRVMAVLDVLSNHSPDEEYLGEAIEPSWAEVPAVKAAFEQFQGRLKELEGIIDERNATRKLKNRHGAGVVPYELLKPFSEAGVTGQGVPYSISI